MKQEHREHLRPKEAEDVQANHTDAVNVDHDPDMANGVEPDDQSWFWTAEWQAEENEATLEIQRGELSKPLRSVEEIRQHLAEL